jgi:hypothetical protein
MTEIMTAEVWLHYYYYRIYKTPGTLSYVAHFSRMDRIRHYHIGCNEEVRRDTPVVGIPGMNKMIGEH